MKKLLLSLGLCLALVGCSSEETSDVLDSGVLVVGAECDYAPYNWTTSESNKSEYAVKIEEQNGYCDGYDIRIASMIADELGVELKVKKINWDGLIPALNSNTIDVIIAGMSPTEERKESINFTDPYFVDSPEMAIIVKKDSEYADASSIADFAGAKITAQQGTLQVDLIEQIDNVGETNPLPDYPSLMQATTSGAIDGYIAEYSIAQEHINSDDSLAMVRFKDDNGFVLSEEFTSIAMGVRKDDTALLDKLNEALASIPEKDRQAMMKEIIEKVESAD